MNIEVIRYRLPVYWACALINDDYTGLSDEEEREINNFLEQAEGYPVDVDLETEGFYRCNDANDVAGDCADFIFISVTLKLNSMKQQINWFIQKRITIPRTDMRIKSRLQYR